MTAHVPAPAIGFTVQTPHANVTDLGTEFGIKVSDDAETHAEVFTGKVRAVAPDPAHPDAAAPNRTLEAGLAVNIPANATIEDAPATPLAFVRPNQFNTFERDGATAYARWHAHERTTPHRPPPPRLLHLPQHRPQHPRKPRRQNRGAGDHSNGQIHNADWQPGRFPEKPALQFANPDSVVAVDIPGQFRQLTNAAWLNINSLDHVFTSLRTSQLADVKITGSSRPLNSDGTAQNSPTPSAPGPTACHLSLFQNSKDKLFIRLGLADDSQPGRWTDFDFPADAIADNLDQWHFIVLTADLDAGLVRCSIDAKPLHELHTTFPLPSQCGHAESGDRTGSSRNLSNTRYGRATRPLVPPPSPPEEIQSLYKARPTVTQASRPRKPHGVVETNI